MCRHLAYLGPPVPVGDLLTRGPHSLRTQSWAPRDMRGGGTINADGFGIAWWTPAPPPHPEGVIWHGGIRQDDMNNPELQPIPVAPVATRYRNAAPIWTDPAVDEVLPQIHSTAVLAAIRSATVGMPLERTACAPFTHGPWAFSHNGAIPDWRNTLTAVAAEFDSPSLLEAESMTDSAALWIILRGLLEGFGSEEAESRGSSSVAADSGPAQAHTVGSAVSLGTSASIRAGADAAARITGSSWASGSADASGAAGMPADHRRAVAGGRRGLAPEVALPLVIRAVGERSPRARLNLLVGDGGTVWACTWGHALSVLVGEEFVVVASEPYDDDSRWQAVGDRQLVVARPGWLSVQDLDIEIGRAGS
ncbi:hypothetical protein GFY24_04860 [Nocardia sp. SYP-A9097]|nr:hypothetical protein [Nocardia sp. SYP-A9097]